MFSNVIQLSPEGEVNSGGIYRNQKCRLGIYLALFTGPEGDICFSIYQISWIKQKYIFFCRLKTSLGRNFLQYTNISRILSSAFLRFCCKFSMKIVFYLLVNTYKPKFVAFSVFQFVGLLYLSLKFRLRKMS